MEKIIEFRDKSKQYPRLFRVTNLIHPKTNKTIQSFHIQESAFKKKDLLPFSARGIFVSPEDNTVIARGYDKFFSINETENTLWKNIVNNTVGPYELTLKENGCIIFVTVFEDDLLVTSKHSITKIVNGNIEVNNYADTGEKWLYKYIGDKKQELIDFIKENNITLVFELVDNDFEEHVLEYSKEEDGLYLHGINPNTVEFNTWPSDKVNEVAKKFNLLTVEYTVYNDIKELKEFADNCNGYYKGKAIEGWVIRCKTTDGGIFFFKYKYDEPYLLYREWREATRAYVNHKPLKYKYMKTYGYIEWVKQKFATDKQLFSQVNQRRGTVNLRNLYLEETHGGQQVENIVESVTKENARYKLILPVGIIGFGKTTVAKMLKVLYDIGHIQSDNIQKKKTAPEFIANVCKEFEHKNIVFADKNNHLKMHRGDLCEKIKTIYPNSLWIVALYWNIEAVPEREILEFARDRIERRGENHQNLTPEKTANYPSIIRMFLNNYQYLDLDNEEDRLIDEVVEVGFKEDSISIVKKLIQALNLEPKTDEELQEAFNKVKEMKPEISQKPKSIAPLYYGLRMKYISGKEIALKMLEEAAKQNDQYVKDYDRVKFVIEKSNFLQREHVTMIFRKRDPPQMFKYYDTLIGRTNQVMNFNNPDLEVTVRVSSIVWTSNIVFMPVDTIDSDKICENPDESKRNEDPLYHITLACYGDVKPIESRTILQKVNQYYKKHPDLKPAPTPNENITVVDESYCIDDSNKAEEEDIIHPKSITQLLPTPLKNTSFVKVIKVVEGPDWKQLFFETIKLKGYYTKFFY